MSTKADTPISVLSLSLSFQSYLSLSLALLLIISYTASEWSLHS